MISTKTVIIAGAGTNNHVGFPLANGLKHNILHFAGHINENLEIPSNMVQAVELAVIDGKSLFNKDELGLIKSAASRLRSSSALTIDDFLQREDNETNKVIKKLIAIYIVKAEEKSLILSRQLSLDRDWLALLLRQYAAKDDASSDPLSVFNNNLMLVTFNYDLYLEHRIFNTLCNDFGFSDKNHAQELIGKIKIIHPHGKLGSLKSTGVTSEENLREYGDFSFLKDNLDALTSEFIGSPLNPEASTTDEAYSQARNAIEGAGRVIFIGFGYHRTVMQKLFPDWELLEIFDQKETYYGSYLAPQQNPGDVFKFIKGGRVSMADNFVDYASFINKYLE